MCGVAVGVVSFSFFVPRRCGAGGRWALYTFSHVFVEYIDIFARKGGRLLSVRQSRLLPVFRSAPVDGPGLLFLAGGKHPIQTHREAPWESRKIFQKRSKRNNRKNGSSNRLGNSSFQDSSQAGLRLASSLGAPSHLGQSLVEGLDPRFGLGISLGLHRQGRHQRRRVRMKAGERSQCQGIDNTDGRRDKGGEAGLTLR